MLDSPRSHNLPLIYHNLVQLVWLKALKSCKVLLTRPILEACDDWGGCLKQVCSDRVCRWDTSIVWVPACALVRWWGTTWMSPRSAAQQGSPSEQSYIAHCTYCTIVQCTMYMHIGAKNVTKECDSAGVSKWTAYLVSQLHVHKTTLWRITELWGDGLTSYISAVTN